MAIEKMERIDPAFALNRREVPKISADHSGSKIAQESDPEGQVSPGGDIKITEKLKELLLEGADLDGDGIISQREAVIRDSRGRVSDANEDDDESSDELSKPEWIAADHSASMLAQDSNNDGYLSLDELRVKNKLKETLLEESDLDGDGIVSQREAVIASSRGGPSKPTNDASEAAEKTEKKTEVQWIDADHSASMIAQDHDADGFMSLDELQLKNKLKETLLSGTDLNGDGIISQREAVLATASGIKGNGIKSARDALEEMFKAAIAEGTAEGILNEDGARMGGLRRSPKPAFSQGAGSHDNGIQDATEAMEEVYRAMLGESTAPKMAESMSQLMGCIGFSRLKAEEFISDVDEDAELRVLA